MVMLDLLNKYNRHQVLPGNGFGKSFSNQQPFQLHFILTVVILSFSGNTLGSDAFRQRYLEIEGSESPPWANAAFREARQFKPISIFKWLKTIPRSVCYEDGLGCFDLKNEDVYKMAHTGVLPISPQAMNIVYELITSANPAGQRFSYTTDPATMGFIPTDPLVVVVHGMGSSIDKQFIREIPEAFVAKEPNHNILSVDWRNGAAFDLFPRTYHQAAANAEMTARILGNFLIRVHNEIKIDFANIHLIGMSLGAQAVGLTGSWLQQKLGTGTKFGRITGLDPAFPLFGEKTYSEEQQRKLSVDSSDATFVDIIHTNYQNKGLGQQLPLGHVDFYINNGIYQPDCPTNIFKALIGNYIFGSVYPSYSCSHDTAYYVFAESIRRKDDCSIVSSGGCQSYPDYIRGKCFFSSASQPSASVGLYTQAASARGVRWALIRGQPEGAKTGYCGFTFLTEVELSSSQQAVSGLLYANSNYTLYSSSSSSYSGFNTITSGKYRGLVLTEASNVASVVLTHELKPTTHTKNQKELLDKNAQQFFFCHFCKAVRHQWHPEVPVLQF